MFDNALEKFDQALLVKINSYHAGWLDVIMWQFSAIYVFVPFAFLLLYLYYQRYKLRNTAALVVCCAISIAFTDLSSNAVKHWIKRYRPTHNTELRPKLHLVKDLSGMEYEGGKYGFFSSHASNTIGVTTVLFCAASWIPRRKRVLFYVIPLLIIYSRMYMGAHYPSDILLGTIDGLLFGYLSFLIFRKFFFKSPLINEE